MKLTIEKIGTYHEFDPLWNYCYQLFLHTETMKIEMGSAHFAYEDCLDEANQLIVEFSKEKVLLVSNEIYDLHP